MFCIHLRRVIYNVYLHSNCCLVIRYYITEVRCCGCTGSPYELQSRKPCSVSPQWCCLLAAFWHFASIKANPWEHSLPLIFFHNSSEPSTTFFSFLLLFNFLTFQTILSCSNCVFSFLYSMMKHQRKMEETE